MRYLTLAGFAVLLVFAAYPQETDVITSHKGRVKDQSKLDLPDCLNRRQGGYLTSRMNSSGRMVAICKDLPSSEPTVSSTPPYGCNSIRWGHSYYNTKDHDLCICRQVNNKDAWTLASDRSQQCSAE